MSLIKRRRRNQGSKLWSNYRARRRDVFISQGRIPNVVLVCALLEEILLIYIRKQSVSCFFLPVFLSCERRPGKRMREEQKQVNERADLDVEIGRRGIVRAAPDRKASQSAHSASFSPFPSAICSPVSSSPSVSSSSKGLRVVSVDSQRKRIVRRPLARMASESK